MGEPIWTTFQIKTPPRWGSPTDRGGTEPTNTFEAGVTLDVYLGDQEILHLVDGSILWTWQGEANYGVSADNIQWAMDWCDRWHVPYLVYDETKYDMEGQIIMSDGFAAVERPYNNSITLSEYAFNEINKRPDSAFNKWTSVVEYFAPSNFDLSACSIAHLPAWPPPDPDDALTADECEEAGVDGTLREVG